MNFWGRDDYSRLPDIRHGPFSDRCVKYGGERLYYIYEGGKVP